MKIPPCKGKRSFQIVTQANTPGQYESVITVRSLNGQFFSYQDDKGTRG